MYKHTNHDRLVWSIELVNVKRETYIAKYYVDNSLTKIIKVVRELFPAHKIKSIRLTYLEVKYVF